jgi:peptidoglycan hydrolase-like protein with peptidoglycan-binding domain
MEIAMRKLILATASVFAIGIGGTAVSHAADAGKTVPNAGWNMPVASASQHGQIAVDLSKDDIRQAQLELRHLGLYNGSLDGVIGPATKRALAQFQRENRLDQTATLDQRTLEAMFGNIGISQGSSVPPNADQSTGSMAYPQPGQSGATHLGDDTAPR